MKEKIWWKYQINFHTPSRKKWLVEKYQKIKYWFRSFFPFTSHSSRFYFKYHVESYLKIAFDSKGEKTWWTGKSNKIQQLIRLKLVLTGKIIVYNKYCKIPTSQVHLNLCPWVHAPSRISWKHKYNFPFRLAHVINAWEHFLVHAENEVCFCNMFQTKSVFAISLLGKPSYKMEVWNHIGIYWSHYANIRIR